jgi:large subunit ribosomal protein L16
MLMPKRVKHRKVFRGRMKGEALRGNYVAFGEFGLQSLDAAWIDSRQIEAARRAITNYVRRGGKVWIRIFPDKPVTQKPAETRMGSGKGNPEYWVAVVRPGRIMFELAGVREDVAIEALRRAAHKLPVQCRVIKRDEIGGLAAEEAHDAADDARATAATSAAAGAGE